MRVASSGASWHLWGPRAGAPKFAFPCRFPISQLCRRQSHCCFKGLTFAVSSLGIDSLHSQAKQPVEVIRGLEEVGAMRPSQEAIRPSQACRRNHQGIAVDLEFDSLFAGGSWGLRSTVHWRTKFILGERTGPQSVGVSTASSRQAAVILGLQLLVIRF